MKTPPQCTTPPLYVGIAGWSYKDWENVVYPAGLPARERLAFLAEFLDCVEINSTFYAIPAVSTVTNWVRQVDDHPSFRFTCKANRALTHEKTYDAGKAEAFASAAAPLERSGKLGAVLAQFPWFFTFSADTFNRIRRISTDLAGYPLVLELRHRSFLHEEFLAFLHEKGIELAVIDLPHTRTSLPVHSFCCGNCAYFRFHGRNSKAWFNPQAGRDQKYDYLYSIDELKPWVQRIRDLAGRTQRIFVITNNHYRGKAVVNALDLAAQLKEPAAAPEPLIEHYPHIRSYGGTADNSKRS